MDDRPNILLLVIDSARADHLSCYGYDLPTTPHIDRLAAEGLRFGAAHSESSWTLPVAFTLLTGLAPREHQAEAVRTLPAGIPTLAQLLQRRGYATFGASSNSFLGPRSALDRGFDEFSLAAQSSFWTQALYRYGPQRLGWADYGGRAMTRRFLRWTAEVRRPWFGLIWHNEPHHPYSARRPFTTRFLRRRMSVSRRMSLVRRMRRMLSIAPIATPGDLADIAGLYDGCLGYADHLVGVTREGLERQGQWDNTAVVVLADHGDMLGEHGLLGHGRTADMYLPLLRVPLVLRVAGLISDRHHFPRMSDRHQSGTSAIGASHSFSENGACHLSDALVQLADVPRTLAALAGVEGGLAPTAAETVDLRDAAAGRGRTLAISERQPLGERSVESARRKSPAFDFAPHLCHMTSVVRDGWRLIHRADGRHGLYHIAVDPDERTDLAAQEPDRLRELIGVVEDWQSRALPHPATEALDRRDDAIVERRLQDLGYF